MSKIRLIFICVLVLLLTACAGTEIPQEPVRDGDTGLASSVESPDSVSETPETGGVAYSFTEKLLYDETVTVTLPEEFSPLTDELTGEKYYTQHLPDYIFANENGSISFTFDTMEQKMRSDEVLYVALGFRSVMQKLNPKGQFISLDTFGLGGTELGYFDYITPTADQKEAYCLFYITPLDDGILLGTFTCPADEYEAWKPEILKLLNSLSTESSRAEPVRGPLTDFWPTAGDADGNYKFRLLRDSAYVSLPITEKNPRGLFPGWSMPTNICALLNVRSPYYLEVPQDESPYNDGPHYDDPKSILGETPAVFLPRSVTAHKGDSLWSIAQREYGDGAQYARIYNANRKVIGADPGRIYENQSLTLPPLLNADISIAGERYKFERRKLYNGKLSMVMPSEFSDMPEYYANIKYPRYSYSDELLVAAICNQETTISFMLSLDNEPFSSEEVYSYLMNVKNIWKVTYPSYTLFEPDIIALEDGETLGYLDYIMPVLDGDTFTVIFVMAVEGNGLMGWFSCDADDAGEWKYYVHEMLRSIRYEGKEETISQNAKTYADSSGAYYDAKNYMAALAEIDKAIKLDSENAKYYQNRGVLYVELNLPQQSLADFDKAIELDPDIYSPYYNRGMANQRMGNYDVAIKDFDKAIELEPDNAEAYHERAFSYWKLGAIETAIEDWNIAIKLEPYNATFIQSRAVMYQRLRLYEEALADYNRAIELDPGEAQYYNERGNYYENTGMYGRAILDFNRAEALDPAVDYSCQHNRAFVYHHLRLYDEAIRDYTEALKYSDKDANTYHNRGLVYRDMKKYDEAISDFTTALCIGEDYPNYAEFYGSRRVAYKQSGEEEKAEFDLTQSYRY